MLYGEWLADSQNYGHCSQEYPGGCILLPIVYLLPVSESPHVSLVTSGVGRALHVVEHDVHALWVVVEQLRTSNNAHHDATRGVSGKTYHLLRYGRRA